MRVCIISRLNRIVLTPTPGAIPGPVVIRFSPRRKDNPNGSNVTKVGIVAGDEWAITVAGIKEIPDQIFPAREIVLHPQYAVRITPKGDAECLHGNIVLWHVHNHRAEDGSSIVGIEGRPPETYEISPAFADETGPTGNPGSGCYR